MPAIATGTAKQRALGWSKPDAKQDGRWTDNNVTKFKRRLYRVDVLLMSDDGGLQCLQMAAKLFTLLQAFTFLDGLHLMSVDKSAEPSESAEHVTAEQMAADEAELRRQLDQLGLKHCDFQDESLAPPVDERVLLRLIRRELPEKTAELLYRRIYSFRSWHEAHTRLLIEEYRRGNDQ